MSNRRGRCFRQHRRTERRKSRQRAAFDALRTRAPAGERVEVFGYGPFGPTLRRIEVDDLSQRQKHKLVQSYKASLRPRQPRRAARGA